MSTEVPIIPPDWYVSNYNTMALAEGLPHRGPLDPLLMFCWHLATGSVRNPKPFVALISGM